MFIMADVTVFDRIKHLSERRGKNIVDVEAELGFSKNYLYKWKKSTPSSDKLAKVADYFHVSTDYLLGRETDKTKTADLADEDTVFTYEGRQIPPEDLEYMKRLLRGGKQ
jgi:transcriptional regulator with XRE-family HTH domain